LVVGIIGRGHLDHRWGVPHQLEDLGIENTAVLLPMAPMDECGQLTAGLADAVFIVPPAERAAKPRPKLGVIVETSAGGARVREVRPNSVAETARIETGDLIVEAAGHPVQTSGDLIRTIARQAPGTWLPLKIERDGKAIEIVARFPAAEPATQ
jgi:S1-C subfamily serine protease